MSRIDDKPEPDVTNAGRRDRLIEVATEQSRIAGAIPGWTGPNYAVAYAAADSPLGPFELVGRLKGAPRRDILPRLAAIKGVYVPDIITILASLYFILGDIDR